MGGVIELKIPDDATPARKTPTFTRSSVPAGLLAAHQTSVWAELIVVAGMVVFVDEVSGASVPIPAGEKRVIVPRQRHHVEPDASAEFFVQFYSS